KLTSVSCPSTSECVAVDSEGEAFVSGNPGVSGSWAPVSVAAGKDLTGVSCGASNLCVAVDSEGVAFASTSPASAGSWTPLGIDPGHFLSGVACASASLCVAVDSSGNAITSSAPATGTWSAAQIAPGGSALIGIACEGGGACTATDAAGDVLTSANPTASETTPNSPGPEWGAANLKAGALPAVSCASGVCVAANAGGESFADEALAARPASWSGSGIGNGNGLGAISCIPGGACVAVAAPSPSGAIESFSAGLPAASGEKTGSTAPPASPPTPPALATPSPLINGDPAPGQTLECEPRLPAGALATVSYQWYANQTPIAGATLQNYKVRAGDEGEHLQCAVTATDAAGSVEKTSGWVAVPRTQAPKSIGETSLGKASVRNGKVRFSVECSAHAVGKCEIEAKLVVYERFHGGTLLGVSASAAKAPRGRQGSATGRAPKVRTVEATIGALKVTVKPGHTRKLSVRLGAAGSRLLATLKGKLSARLTVSGTLIGVLSGKIGEQAVKLGPAKAGGKAKKAKKASAKIAHARRAHAKPAQARHARVASRRAGHRR
ncbi:MAG: hypothetical protein ACYCX7_05625, partial [Solirubrobacteraceae bacterium]